MFIFKAAVVVQWIRAFVQQAEDWVFKSQPRQTLVVKTGSDSSTAKRSALGVSGTEMTIINGCPMSQYMAG